MPPGGLCHRPLAAGQDGLLRQRPEPGPHPGGGGLCRHCRPGPDRIDLYLDDVHVAVKGGRNPAYREEDGQRVMKQSEITVRVLLGRGDAPGHGVDLRLQPRLRDDQRRLPFLIC
jgi:hypothetical protein